MRKKIIIGVSSLIVFVVVLISSIFIVQKAPDIYSLDRKIDVCYQPGDVECAGYASANALRIYGLQGDGDIIYEGIPNKLMDGTVVLDDLSSYLKSIGYNNKAAYNCSLEGLKRMICRKDPVIVLARYRTTSDYLHYFTIVGYDKDYVYAIDSLRELANDVEEDHNRKIPMDEFLALWDIPGNRDHVYMRFTF